MAPEEYSIAYVTVPDTKVGERLANELLKQRLAACVNIVPGLRSFYWWEDKIDTSEEVLLLVKTRSTLAAELIEFIRSEHPYDVPEVITCPIRHGNRAYLEWIGANTGSIKRRGAGIR